MIETFNERLLMIADFGQQVSARTQSSGSFNFKAIFDNQHSLEESGMGVAFSVLQPQLTCITSEVKNIQYGDTLITDVDGDSTTFVVRVIMPDGTGITELKLERQ